MSTRLVYASIAQDTGKDLERELPRVQLQPEAARTEAGQGQLTEGLAGDAKYIRTIAHTLGAYHTSRFENNPCGIRFVPPEFW
jgi:hypothetical protein